MIYKKIILLTFLIISTFFNLFEFIGSKFDKLNMFYPYYENQIITWLNIITIAMSLLMILIISFYLSNSNILKGKRNILILICTIILIALIWFEIYYGSTFYYGEIRDKQLVWCGVNNFGAIGSIILSFSLIEFKPLQKKYKLWLETLFFLLLVIIHFVILSLLNEKWRLFLL
jgi:hypothetical protein